MPVKNITRLLVKAQQKKEKNKAWDMWLQRYQHMTEKDYMPFNEFYRILTQKLDQTPTKDILAEAEQIRKKARKEGD